MVRSSGSVLLGPLSVSPWFLLCLYCSLSADARLLECVYSVCFNLHASFCVSCLSVCLFV